MKKPRPTKAIGRKRRTLGWTLLTLGLLVAAVWVWSGWWWLNFQTSRARGQLSLGVVAVEWLDDEVIPEADRYVHKVPISPTGIFLRWHLTVPTGGARRMFLSVLSTERSMSLNIATVLHRTKYTMAFWPIPLLLWTPAALLLRSGIVARRRAVKGMCRKCGYDLAGFADDALCPECGKGAKVTA